MPTFPLNNCNHKVITAIFSHPLHGLGLLSVRTNCNMSKGLVFSTRLPLPIETESDEEALVFFEAGVKASASNKWSCFYLGEPNEG